MERPDVYPGRDPILRCHSRPWLSSDLVVVKCPGCGVEHTHRLEKEDLTKEDIGYISGFIESGCKPDNHRRGRKPIDGYFLIYCGVST